MHKFFLISASCYLLTFHAYAMEKDISVTESSSPSSHKHVTINGPLQQPTLIRKEPLVFEEIQPTPFKTGLQLWMQQKENFKLFVLEQFIPMKESYRGIVEVHGSLEIMASSGKLRNPILYKQENIIADINLEFTIKPNTYAAYQLYYAFNQALFDIHDLISDFQARALYLRSDLTKLSNVCQDTLSFFMQAQTLAKKLFGVNLNSLRMDEIKSSNINYIPAKLIDEETKRYMKHVKNRYDGKIGIYEYINFYSKLYHTLFQNYLVVLQAHLQESEDENTIKLLDRPKPEGALTEEYNLIRCSLPAFEQIKVFEAPSDGSGAIASSTKKKRTKKSHRRKNKHSLAIKVSKSPTSVKQESCTPPQEETENIYIISSLTEDNKTLASGKRIEPDAIDLTPMPNTDELYQTSRATILEARKVEEKVVKAPVEVEESTDFNPKTSKTKTQTLRQNEPRVLPPYANLLTQNPNNATTRLIKLEKALGEYDGGAYAGMKTRHFLRLANALNDLGYFSEFQANKKQVRVNTKPTPSAPKGHIATFHTGHIPGKTKGLSKTTASTFNNIIESLKNSKTE